MLHPLFFVEVRNLGRDQRANKGLHLPCPSQPTSHRHHRGRHRRRLFMIIAFVLAKSAPSFTSMDERNNQVPSSYVRNNPSNSSAGSGNNTHFQDSPMIHCGTQCQYRYLPHIHLHRRLSIFMN